MERKVPLTGNGVEVLEPTICVSSLTVYNYYVISEKENFMEKVFFVRYGDLEKVNEALAKGGKIKMISAVGEQVAAASDARLTAYGKICAYIVVEM